MPAYQSFVSFLALTLLGASFALAQDASAPGAAGAETVELQLAPATTATEAAGSTTGAVATKSDEPKPHAELGLKVEEGVTVSYLKVENEDVTRQTISVEISGFESDTGTCAVMMSAKKQKYARIDPRKPRSKWISAAATAADTVIKDRKTKFIIKDVPHGEYVFAAFHDENKNKLLDTNRLGIPTEAYGFSNGVRWRLKIPRWSLAHVKVDEEHTSFSVKVK